MTHEEEKAILGPASPAELLRNVARYYGARAKAAFEANRPWRQDEQFARNLWNESFEATDFRRAGLVNFD